ncbi:winged helix-turn-helix transcriptional regulator [Microbacterium saccharophilum]|uniref:Winged helix-turn-helix transcriptional regulator n=1 Tax=Microbacterium saccharophilum TaxID=1213358 RepID=A0A5C8I0F4_9MICO|nr:winged helix-turn-helix domain-containing protein [Microbacterium saccharophilum]TXK11203.1 winged helix-turn-helix transcriptional regulator [Microbacterium saccharophilum]
MPKYAKPVGGEGAEQAISVFGNYVKAAAIRYLRQHPNVTRKSIADALQLPPTTFVAYLGELEEAGLIVADPPRTERRKGEWPVYRVNDAEVTALYLRLGQELGEI